MYINLVKHKADTGVSYECSEEFISIEGYDVLINGSFYVDDIPMTPLSFLSLYCQYGEYTYQYLDGCGTTYIIDRSQKRIFVFTDFFNSNSFTFYRFVPDGIMLSDNIFRIIDSTRAFEIDEKSAKYFLVNGYVSGGRTLVKDIMKVSPKTYLEIDMNSCEVHIHRCEYKFDKCEVTKFSYSDSFEKCVVSCMQNAHCAALSGGYDSNFIIWNVKGNSSSDNRLNAFCIGGTAGTDETKVAQKIAEYYGNIDLHIGYVSPETLNHLPEIVMALQGQIYEKGIFLQYE